MRGDRSAPGRLRVVLHRALALACLAGSGVCWVLVAVFAVYDGYAEDVGQPATDFTARIRLLAVLGVVFAVITVLIWPRRRAPRPPRWGRAGPRS